ncbi:hypothetical protein CN627_00250 [Bacillus wiedmannii]|nr:hypothetical protein CN627_00250 [Bacillus wiedmannii]
MYLSLYEWFSAAFLSLPVHDSHSNPNHTLYTIAMIKTHNITANTTNVLVVLVFTKESFYEKNRHKTFFETWNDIQMNHLKEMKIPRIVRHINRLQLILVIFGLCYNGQSIYVLNLGNFLRIVFYWYHGYTLF